MIKEIIACTSRFPVEYKDKEFWHLHLPVPESFIDSPRTPFSIRKLCVQTLIDRVSYLINLKPEDFKDCRVAASLSLPRLWDSQIILFIDRNYFNSFFNRDNEYQKWEIIQDKNLLSSWRLNIPEKLKIKHYQEDLFDEDYHFTNQLVFIGELDPIP